MSILVMTQVWAKSAFEGGNLLLLLAMADHADDNGYCWPSVAKLASKSRMSERNVQRCLRDLEKANEIRTIKPGGIKGERKLATVYRVLIGRDLTDDKLSPVSPMGDMAGTRRVTPTSPQPSLESSILLASVEEIYAAYPKKVGKPAALKSIAKAIKLVGAPELLAKTKAFAAARNGNVEFVPHPATWFNQHRFNDDPETWKPNDTNQKPAARGSGRNEGTANEGKHTQYGGRVLRSVRLPARPGSEGDEKGGGAVSNGHAGG